MLTPDIGGVAVAELRAVAEAALAGEGSKKTRSDRAFDACLDKIVERDPSLVNSVSTALLLDDWLRELIGKPPREAGSPTYGKRHRCPELGKYLVSRDASTPPDDPIAKMNRAYAVAHLGADVVILHEHDDPTTRQRAVDFVKPSALSTWFKNRFVDVPTDQGPKRKPLFEHWLTHRDRRAHSGVVFEPGAPGASPDTGDHFNLWRGWAVEPNARGEEGCRLFLDHLRDVLCDGDDARFAWLVAWLADAVQNPGRRPGTSVALQGPQGGGKTVVGRYLGAMYGPHYVYLNDGRCSPGDSTRCFRTRSSSSATRWSSVATGAPRTS